MSGEKKWFTNAWIYTEGFRFERGSFAVRDGVFAEVLTEAEGQPGVRDDVTDLKGAYVIPGLVDIHVHGIRGDDYTDGDRDAAERMEKEFAQRGVTTVVGTTVTAPEEELFRALSCGAYMRTEGPFLSPARKGAQNGAYLKAPDAGLLARLKEASGGRLKIIDIAPELPGAIDLIKEASKELTVSVAHTDCDYETAHRAFDAGATGLTHMFNAMPPLHHRMPGVIAAALERENVFAELIADGIHVHPAIVRLAFRLFGAERIVLISDALRCAGMPEGTYTLGGQEVTLRDGAAYLKDGTLAGAGTDLYGDMLKAVSFGIPREDAVRAATYNPARHAGILDTVGSIRAGKRADFAVCDEGLSLKAAYRGGIC